MNTPESYSTGATPFTAAQKIILTLLCFADCMVVLDFSIVNVAIPSIQKSLGFTPENIQWIVTGYGLVFGGFMLLGGKLSDLYGRKHIFLGGMALFTLASFLGGCSTTPLILVAMRCLQGLGAALLAPSAMALLMGIFPEGPSRNRAFGIWGTVAAAGYSIGVVLGGVLTAWLGWRFILFVNVPLGIGVLFAAARLLREPDTIPTKPKLDILGSILVTSGLMTLVFALAISPTYGWASWVTWRVLLLAITLLTAFIVVEARSPEPLMPLRIFSLPGIAAANIVCTFLSAAMVAMNLILTLYFQNILGYSALTTGLAFLPHGIAAIIAGPLGGKWANRFGPKKVLVVGLGIALICLTLLSFISSNGSYWTQVMPLTVLMSFGIMPAFVNLISLATSGIETEDHGLVSGIVNTTGQLGGAIGLAILIAVASACTLHISQQPQYSKVEAMLSGYRVALFCGALFMALSLAVALLGLKQRNNPIENGV